MSKWKKQNKDVYYVWTNAKSRCFKNWTKRFKDYGGRGITMYLLWVSNFDAFAEYIKSLPDFDKRKTDNYTLDRINNNGNYEPGNLKWSSKQMQSLNKRVVPVNTIGYIGVQLHFTGRYLATIYNKRRSKYLGLFPTPEAAVAARNAYIIANNLPHPVQEIKAA